MLIKKIIIKNPFPPSPTKHIKVEFFCGSKNWIGASKEVSSEIKIKVRVSMEFTSSATELSWLFVLQYKVDISMLHKKKIQNNINYKIKT